MIILLGSVKKCKRFLKIHRYTESKAITQTANNPLPISTTCLFQASGCGC